MMYICPTGRMVLALIGLRILCKITNIHSFTEGNSVEEIMRKKIQANEKT